jgi:hypothetical protein
LNQLLTVLPVRHEPHQLRIDAQTDLGVETLNESTAFKEAGQTSEPSTNYYWLVCFLIYKKKTEEKYPNCQTLTRRTSATLKRSRFWGILSLTGGIKLWHDVFAEASLK